MNGHIRLADFGSCLRLMEDGTVRCFPPSPCCQRSRGSRANTPQLDLTSSSPLGGVGLGFRQLSDGSSVAGPSCGLTPALSINGRLVDRLVNASLVLLKKKNHTG